MSIYLFWGEDSFAMTQAVEELRNQNLDANWLAFNDHKLSGDTSDTVIEGLNQAMTPPFGMGKRFVWLAETTIFHSCSESLYEELERTLPNIPETSCLLFSLGKKPDGRSKVTKLLQKCAQVREFSLIPPWKVEELLKRVETVAKQVGVSLTQKAAELLAESVGNDTRQLWNELEKLKLYGEATSKPVDETVVARMVVANTQSSLQLAAAIRQGNCDRALGLVTELLQRNEPPLKIVATLIGQFRTWVMVKLMIENGERDEKAIASIAEIGNPKRIYFLRKEIESLSSPQLLQTLPLLLRLETSLKRGEKAKSTLQTKIVELCQVCQPH